MRDAVLAAEVHTLRVHVLHALPRVGLGVEYRIIVRGRDASVVVEDVDAAVARRRFLVHAPHALGVRDVDLHCECVARVRCGLLGRVAVDVGDADLRTLLGEEVRGVGSHAAAGAGDDADLAREPVHSVE